MLGPRLDSPNELPNELPIEVPNELPNELLNELLRPRGEDDPKLGRRPVSLPPVATAL